MNWWDNTNQILPEYVIFYKALSEVPKDSYFGRAILLSNQYTKTPMRTATFSFLSFCCALLLAVANVAAQNIVISTVNPSGLYVCGEQQLSVTVQNTAGSPTATNVQVSIDFPTGVSYVPGTLVVGNAVEFNITNLNTPIFALTTDLAGGSTVTLTLSVTAGCALVDDINAGIPFSNNITVTYAGGTKQLTSGTYIMNTGLGNISSVVPAVVATAMKGDVITRTITLRNTREGAIESLSFRDQHQNGLEIDLQGGINQTNAATLFRADVPGSYFASFGDGDNLLEDTDGEITLVETITVTDCGFPPFTNTSEIIIGWGCGGAPCRSDSIEAYISIVSSTQNPILTFEHDYARPLSFCGAVPSVQEIRITNTGQLPAENVAIDVNVFVQDTNYMGLDSASFAWSNGGVVWQHTQLIPAFMDSTFLPSCAMDQYFRNVVAVVPLVPAGETVRLRFNSYFCQPVCLGLYPRMEYTFSYNKACPDNFSVAGTRQFFPDTNFLKVTSQINYEIGTCLQDDVTYPLTYWVRSQRLTVDTGVLQVIIELPLGLEWDPNCPFNLDGQTPLEFGLTTDASGSTTVRAVFDLPFTQDSVATEQICIKYNCQMDLPCQPIVENVPPRGSDYIVYPPPEDCDGCELEIRTYSVISLLPTDTKDCGITACDEFNMVVDDICNGGGSGDASIVSGSVDLAVGVGFDSWRLNRGLQDDQNDREPDSDNAAAHPDIRLDRFITGDTMRTELRIGVQAGTLATVDFRLFIESLWSDSTTIGADAYDIKDAQIPFVNFDSTLFAGGNVIIKKANGQTTICPIELPTVRTDQQFIQVADPNIRPDSIIDKVASMFDQYNFSVADHIANGCLPQGFTITAGDSLFFQTDYKFTNNFTPEGGAPPLINFRASVCDTLQTYSWLLENFCTEKPIRQFSGFLESFSAPRQRLNPCDSSSEITPFHYEIRIARENMFPFEVRPLSEVYGYSYTLPGSIGLLDTKLSFLNLQQNRPWFPTTPLTPILDAGNLKLDLDPFFIKPLDEGYSFEISTHFDTICNYNGTAFGNTTIGLRYPDPCFNSPVEQDISIENPLDGFQNGSPQLQFSNTGPNIIVLPTNNVQMEFTIGNFNSNAPALYPWIIIESDNNLSDVQLFQLFGVSTFVPVPNVGGVYQLDTIKPNTQPFYFRLVAKNTSCGPYTVRFRFGWGCAPTYNDQVDGCGEFSETVEFRPQPPELELTFVQPASIPLCAPSDDFEMLITNANDGAAYNVVPTVKLPPGISIVPGSSRLIFPLGGAAIVMPQGPDQQLPGNVWTFHPESVPGYPNTLVGEQTNPARGFRILFKVRAECRAVANVQPVYGAEAVQPCGISSNVLRKPGPQLGIIGVNPVNMASPILTFSNPNAPIVCGQPIQLSATIQLEGVPSAGDSIYITLPAGTSYVVDSYTPGSNAPAGAPDVIGQVLQWPLPTNGGLSATVVFTFSIRYDDAAGCADKIVSLQTRETTEALCGGSACTVYVATGEWQLTLNAQNPQLQLNNFQLQPSTGGQTNFTANLENAGTTTANNPVVLLYHDVNMNGQIDGSDVLLTTVTQANTTITPGATLAIGGNITLPASAYCDLIALIPADENCACDDRVFPLGGHQLLTTGIGLCQLQPVPVGTAFVAGNTYAWQPIPGLVCTDANCNNAIYTPGPEVPLGALVTIVLVETSSNCTIERRFDIQFGGDYGIETAVVPPICQGNSATLEATPGGLSYNWSGPGITNATQQTLIVTPTEAGIFTYSVTVTFAGGCPPGTGTATVTVNPSPQSELQQTTCDGLAINVFAGYPELDPVVTDVPGVYTDSYIGVNGCPNVVTVTLTVPEDTQVILPLCAGQFVVLENGDTIRQPGTFCKNVLTSTGCIIQACEIVVEVPNPNIPAQDSVIVQVGTQITLDGPSGFTTYSWTPPDALDCSDCEDPVATPDSTTNFILAVTDGNMCRDTVQYRVVTCDVKNLKKLIPNAFTPNGDGSNDIFRLIPNEGAEMVVLLQVYNRWGAKVYEGSGPNAGWDGLIGDKPAASDVYVYILTAECSGIRMTEQGEITLLR